MDRNSGGERPGIYVSNPRYVRLPGWLDSLLDTGSIDADGRTLGQVMLAKANIAQEEHLRGQSSREAECILEIFLGSESGLLAKRRCKTTSEMLAALNDDSTPGVLRTARLLQLIKNLTILAVKDKVVWTQSEPREAAFGDDSAEVLLTETLEELKQCRKELRECRDSYDGLNREMESQVEANIALERQLSELKKNSALSLTNAQQQANRNVLALRHAAKALSIATGAEG